MNVSSSFENDNYNDSLFKDKIFGPFSVCPPASRSLTAPPEPANPPSSSFQSFYNQPYSSLQQSFPMLNNHFASVASRTPSISLSQNSYLTGPFSSYNQAPNISANTRADRNSFSKPLSFGLLDSDVSQYSGHTQTDANTLSCARFENISFSLTKDEKDFNPAPIDGTESDKTLDSDLNDTATCECNCHSNPASFRLDLYMRATANSDSGHFYSRLPFRPYFDYTTPLADYVYRDKHALASCPDGKYPVGDIKKCCNLGCSMALAALKTENNVENLKPSQLSPQTLMRSFLSKGDAIADTCLVSGGEMPEKLSNETKNVIAWYRKMKRAVFSQEKYGGLDKQQLHGFLLKSVKYNLRCQVSYAMACDGADYDDPIAWSQYLLEITYDRFALRADLRNLVSELHKRPTNDMESRRFVRLHADYQAFYNTTEGYFHIVLSNFDDETTRKIEENPEVKKLMVRYRIKKDVSMDQMKKTLHEAIISLFSPNDGTYSKSEELPEVASNSAKWANYTPAQSSHKPQMAFGNQPNSLCGSQQSQSKKTFDFSDTRKQSNPSSVGFDAGNSSFRNDEKKTYAMVVSEGFEEKTGKFSLGKQFASESGPVYRRGSSFGSSSSDVSLGARFLGIPGRTSTPRVGGELSTRTGTASSESRSNFWKDGGSSMVTEEDNVDGRGVTQGSTSTASTSIQMAVGSRESEDRLNKLDLASRVSSLELAEPDTPSVRRSSCFENDGLTCLSTGFSSFDGGMGETNSLMSGSFMNSFSTTAASSNVSPNLLSMRESPPESVWMSPRFVEATNEMFVKIYGLPRRAHVPFVHVLKCKPNESVITREERLYRFRHELCPSCGNHFRDKDSHCFTGDERSNLGKDCVLHPYYYLYFGGV